MPQTPQLAGSRRTSTQLPPQRIEPAPQVQTPSEQASPAGQRFPQLPQLALSTDRFVHPALQGTSPVAQVSVVPASPALATVPRLPADAAVPPLWPSAERPAFSPPPHPIKATKATREGVALVVVDGFRVLLDSFRGLVVVLVMARPRPGVGGGRWLVRMGAEAARAPSLECARSPRGSPAISVFLRQAATWCLRRHEPSA